MGRCCDLGETREFRRARLLIEALPEPHRTILIEGGERGAYDTPEYEAAMTEFYGRHLCRMDPWPARCRRASPTSTATRCTPMNGPTEFDVIGTLVGWDRTADLGRIDVPPTLITVGRHDEIPPSCAETLRAGIPDAQVVVLEHSAHISHLEEPETYLRAMRAFLSARPPRRRSTARRSRPRHRGPAPQALRRERLELGHRRVDVGERELGDDERGSSPVRPQAGRSQGSA